MNATADFSLFYSSLEEINNLYLQAIDHLSLGETSHFSVREFYIKLHSLKGSSGLMGFNNHSHVAHGMESALKGAISGTLKTDEELIKCINHGMELLNSSSLNKETAEKFFSGISSYKVESVVETDAAQEKSYFLNMPEELYNALSPEERTKILNLYRDGKNLFILYAFLPHQNVGKVFEILKKLNEKGLSPVSSFAVMPEDGLLGVGRIFVSEKIEKIEEEKELAALWSRGYWFAINAPLIINKKDAPISLRLPLSRYESLLSKISEIYFNFDMIEEKNELRRIIQDIYIAAKEIGDTPIKPVFSQLLIYAKNSALKLGKEIEFVFKGEHTEVSYIFHNIIKEMLVILINNAVSHAIIPAKDRIKLGKPGKGRIEVSVERQETDMIVSISDDGEGIDEAEIAKNFSLAGSKDLWEIISAPSFSTSKGVDTFSGRGNGLAFIRESVDHFNGSVRLINKIGKGVTFLITIPLSTSLIKIFPVFIGDCSAAFLTAEIAENCQEGDQFINFTKLISVSSGGHLKIMLAGRKNFKALFYADAVAPESKENVHVLPSRLKEAIPIYGAFVRLENKKHTPILSAAAASKMFIMKSRSKFFRFEHSASDDIVYLRRDTSLYPLPVHKISSICAQRNIVDCNLKLPKHLSGFILQNGIVIPIISHGENLHTKMVASISFSTDAAVGIYIDEIMSREDIEESKTALTVVSERDFLAELEQTMESVRTFYLSLLSDGEIIYEK